MKTTLKATMIATAAAAAAIALPATANAGVPPTFETPSHNILCWVSETMTGCQIVDYTYSVSPLPPECKSGQYPGGFMLMSGQPAKLSCNDTPPGTYNGIRGHRTLDYGQSQTAGAMTCVSETSGVTCTDTSSGHFFRVSRDSFQLG